MGPIRFRTPILCAIGGAIAAFTMSACGGSDTATITLVGSVSGTPVVWGVVTTDSVAMAVIRQSAGTTAGGAVIQDGDSHSGSRVCGFNVSKDGHNYQVDYYTNNPAAAAEIESSACSSSAQQQLLSDAP